MMIPLTRLNGSKLYLNCDLLKFTEASPDTVLTLIAGEKIVVLESCERIAELSLAYHAQVLRTAWPDARGAIAAVLSTPGHEN